MRIRFGTYFFGHLVFETINLFWSQPSEGFCHTAVMAHFPRAKGAVYQFKGVVSVHSSKKAIFQKFLALKSVETWGTYMSLSPVRLSTKGIVLSRLNFALDLQVGIISGGQLISQMGSAWVL